MNNQLPVKTDALQSEHQKLSRITGKGRRRENIGSRLRQSKVSSGDRFLSRKVVLAEVWYRRQESWMDIVFIFGV